MTADQGHALRAACAHLCASLRGFLPEEIREASEVWDALMIAERMVEFTAPPWHQPSTGPVSAVAREEVEP